MGDFAAYVPINFKGMAMTLAKSISVTSPISLPKFLNGGGAAGETLRGIDWSSHALGAPDTWPTMLKSMTNLVLRARQPMFVMWGPEYHLIYKTWVVHWGSFSCKS